MPKCTMAHIPELNTLLLTNGSCEVYTESISREAPVQLKASSSV
jgi:hypothetical protein